MKAVYAGTFDPFTNGHLYVYSEAMKLFDEVIILMANNPKKKRYFSEDRVIKGIREIPEVHSVEKWNGLVADYCRQHDVEYLIRGLRNVDDYIHEETIAKVNQEIYPKLKTIYIRAQDDVTSSTMVRLLYEYKKPFGRYVPYSVYTNLID